MNVLKYRYEPKQNPLRKLQNVHVQRYKQGKASRMPDMSREQESCEFLGVTEDYGTEFDKDNPVLDVYYQTCALDQNG